jgi:hypothetical protein
VKIKKTNFSSLLFDNGDVMDGVGECSISIEERIFSGINLEVGSGSVIRGEVPDGKEMIIKNCTLEESD